MKKKIRVFLALGVILTAALGLTGNALAISLSEGTGYDRAGAAFDGAAYHGDPAACVMTSGQARALASKLGELMGEYNDDSYRDGFIRRAALVDMGSGVPALYYYEGVSAGETPNPIGPGSNGSVDYFTANCSAWEFKDGALVEFTPGWYYDGYMVYEFLSGNGRSGTNYVVPIENGVMELLPDEDGYLWIGDYECLAWYDWALGSLGTQYSEGYEGYEDMHAGENDEYREVLENPGAGSALGVFEDRYVGLGEASRVWLALSAYAQKCDAADVSDPAALVQGYGDVDISALTPELLRGYAGTLRELPGVEVTSYGTDTLYNFATLLRGGDGTVLLWVVPAVMSSDWWGSEQYFTYNGAPFVGRDHLLFGWDGANVREIRIPGLNQIRYWPEEGVELTKVYYGTDVDGQTWEMMYSVENGGLAAQPQWCHASGFLYGYALEDAGLGDQVPADLETRLSRTRSFFDYKTNQGQWPYLPLDWNTFTTRSMMEDTIDFDVSGGDYRSFRQVHEVYNAQYDYKTLDTSVAGSYMDIENMPGKWLLSDELADRLDAMAAMLEEESRPPVEAAGDEDRAPDGGDTDGAEDAGGVKDEDTSGATPDENGPADPGDDRNDERDEAKNEEKDTEIDRDGDREEKKDAPVGLIAGVAGIALAVGGGAGAAVTILSKKRREKAGKSDGGPGQVRVPTETPPQTPRTPRNGSAAAFCPNCGAPHAAGAKFCSKCGAKL